MWIVDPICTYLFAIIVLYTSKDPFIECMRLILERAPDNIDTQEVKKRLESIEGVKEVQNIHIWALSNEKVCFTCHIVLRPDMDGQEQRVLQEADKLMRSKFDIHNNCIQVELPGKHGNTLAEKTY